MGLYVAIAICFIEELLAIPEFLEFNLPFWYSLCLGLSLVPGIMALVYSMQWVKLDNRETRQALIFAF